MITLCPKHAVAVMDGKWFAGIGILHAGNVRGGSNMGEVTDIRLSIIKEEARECK